MTTAINSAQHTVSSYTTCRPRGNSFSGRFNFGPRYNEGHIQVTRSEPGPMPLLNPREFELYYRIYNPSALHSEESPPLLIVHGGPSLPSDYLYPLVAHFPTSRSIIFYDQLGCGRSARPEDKKMYSIENAVHDLEELIRYLKLDKFHLLGHSFGGIVAYEASKIDDKCLSLTLDSTPSNMKLSLDEVSRLENEVKSEIILESSSDSDCSDSESDSLESKEEMKKLVQDRLRRRNECRTDTMPESLAMAIESRGTTFEADDCADYVACPPSSHSLPPTLLIRGEHDFVTEKCIEGWRDIFLNWKTTSSNSNRVSYREEEMSNCAHYCHLEDAKGFAELIKGHCFINDY